MPPINLADPAFEPTDELVDLSKKAFATCRLDVKRSDRAR
jgi:hypothetical protein